MNIKSLIKLTLIYLLVLKCTAAFGFDLDMDFENGTPGASAISNGNCKLNGSPAFTSGGSGNKFSDVEAFGSGQSVAVTVNKKSTGWGGVFDFKNCEGGKELLKGDELWIRIRTYFPVGFDYTAAPYLKFMRLNTKKYEGCVWPDNCGQGRIDWEIVPRDGVIDGSDADGNWVGYRDIPFVTGKEGYAASSQGWRLVGDKSTAIKLGQWSTYEWYLKFDKESVDDGGEAIMRFWKDGILMKEVTDLRTIDTDTTAVDLFMLYTWWNLGSPKTQTMYIDDLRFVASPDVPSEVDADSNPMIGVSTSIPKPPVVILNSTASN